MRCMVYLAELAVGKEARKMFTGLMLEVSAVRLSILALGERLHVSCLDAEAPLIAILIGPFCAPTSPREY